MNDFNNGLEDIFTSERGGFTGRVIWLLATAVFWSLSAATTFGFFATYAENLGAWLYPPAGWVVAGLQGVLLLDTATFIWSYLSRSQGTTVEQITVSRATAWGTLVGALLVSFLFVLFSVSFELGIYDAAGSPTTFGLIMSWIGSAVMTLAFVGNFLAAALFAYYSPAAQIAMQNAELGSIARAGQFVADRKRAANTISESLRTVNEQLPALTRRAGQENARRYIDTHFGDLNGDGVIDEQDEEIWQQQLPPRPTPRPPQQDNGRGQPHRTQMTRRVTSKGLRPYPSRSRRKRR